MSGGGNVIEGLTIALDRERKLVEELTARVEGFKNELLEADNKLVSLEQVVVRKAPHAPNCNGDSPDKCTCWKLDAYKILGRS